MAGNGSVIALKTFCAPLSAFWYGPLSSDANVSSVNSNITKIVQPFDTADLTLCFQETVVLYGLSLVFALLLVLRMICGQKRVFRIGTTWLNVTKLVFCGLLMVPAVMDLGKSIWQAAWIGVGGEDTTDSEFALHQEVAVVQLVTPLVFVVDMFLAGLLVLREKHLGMKSSGLQFVFWGSLLLYQAMRLRSLSLIHQDDIFTRGLGGEWRYIDLYRFITTVGTLFLILVQFVLSLFKDRAKSSILVIKDRPSPELDATFLSRVTWWWQNGMIFRGYRKALDYSNLWSLNPEDRSDFVGPLFEKEWEKELKKAGIAFGQDYNPFDQQSRGNPSLVFALVRAFGGTFVIAGAFKLIQDMLSFVNPLILGLLINFVDNHNPNEVYLGFLYAAVMFCTTILQSLLLNQYFDRCMILGMRLRAAVVHAVYRKSLRLSSLARKDSTTGEIVNLMAIDAQRFMDLLTYLHMLWSAPFQVVLSVFFLYQTMGPSVFAGLAVLVLLIPTNAVVSIISRKYQVKQMIFKDSRIKLMNEILNGIKVIKLYAWENHFVQTILGIRKDELRVLRASALINAFSFFTFLSTPFMTAIATFGTFVLVNGRLTSEKAFVALSLFNLLKVPLMMLPFVVSSSVEASVSVKRLGNFLKKPELNPDNVDYSPDHPKNGEPAIGIDNGHFTWDTPHNPILSKINLKIKQGQLVAVVGPVGAGKSSLLSAFLGEMEKLQGRVTVRGKVAYVPQQAWIQNNTVKENILFGRPMDGSYYDRTIRSCALGPDLEILPGGDMSEIGEKGINLSGGQKQRISIARAVYQKSDIYLLDDPLSAVDSHVGKHIFDQVIGPDGLLKTKTRVLVTHGLGFLPQCDLIVVLDQGRILEVGTYRELIDSDQHFAEFMRTYAAGGDDNEEAVIDGVFSDNQEMEALEEELTAPPDELAIFSDNPAILNRRRNRREYLERRLSEGQPFSLRQALVRSSSTPLPPPSPSKKKKKMKKTVAMHWSRQTSSVTESSKESVAKKDENTRLIAAETAEKGNVKLSVLLSYGKATTWPVASFTIGVMVAYSALGVGSNFWLAGWSTQEDENPALADEKTGENIGVYAALGVAQAIGVLLSSVSLAIGAVIASSHLHSILLKNAMRSPMSFFDTTPLGRVLNRFSKDVYVVDETVPRCLRAVLATGLNVVGTIIVIIVATPYFLIVMVPLFILYFIIQRIYVAASRQLKRLESVSRSPIYSHFQETLNGVTTIRAYHKQDEFMEESECKVDYNQEAYYPWICSNRWLAIRLEFIGNLVVFFAALFAVLAVVFPDASRTITPGLAGLSISYALQVTGALNWMVRMTSELEANIVSVERMKEYSETPTEAASIVEHNRPARDWPRQGRLVFRDYSTRYRDGLDLVLRGIACDIQGGQKVGIVGRTGAGKSSLTMALFRIIEPASGQILIDDVDVAGLGLYDLRSRITIIPQDPVLFSDTLRVNLDPFEHHTDAEIWRALETAHLKKFVQELEEGLSHMVSEGGENLSVGQRQLVCLARALLRKTKILVLDEATAAVDMETDDFIQKTIRKEFADCTVVTIAHRLNTIMDYDRIIVLSDGRIVEFDTPKQLLAKQTMFYAMAKDAGLV